MKWTLHVLCALGTIFLNTICIQFHPNAVSPKLVSKFRPNAVEELDQPVSSTYNKTQSLTLYRLHFPKLYTSPM
jgi:hypothetical protein